MTAFGEWQRQGRASEWRKVVGWESFYEVSATGLLRKLDGTPVGIWPNGRGYPQARLAKPRKVVSVHRIVADAFVPNPDRKPCVNHIDNNPSNNRSDNLEWCTQAENLAHMTRQGRRSKAQLGRRSPFAALSDDQVRRLRAGRESGLSHSALATEFGLSKRAIGRCLSGETYADVL